MRHVWSFFLKADVRRPLVSGLISVVLPYFVQTAIAQTGPSTGPGRHASALKASVAQKFAIGMERESLHAIFGVPTRWYAGEVGYIATLAEYKAAIGIYNVGDVYERRTPRNLYELQFYYSTDDSQSRLHPKLKLSVVLIKGDHPLPLVEMLQDIPEAVDMCSSGCGVAPQSRDVTYASKQTFVYPLKGREEDASRSNMEFAWDSKSPKATTWSQQQVVDVRVASERLAVHESLGFTPLPDTIWKP